MIAIAIDGPAGAGKSTAAKEIARRLGFIYVDTGALYRAIGLLALRKGKDTRSAEEVCGILPFAEISVRFDNGEQKVFLGEEDVTSKIRTGEVSMAASNVSAIQDVRDYLFELQQKLGRENNVVMDGRDIGTVVLPWADVKIFLTASDEVRAERRHKENLQKGIESDYNTVLEEIKQRDLNDSTREAAPLRVADGAIVVNTDNMGIEEVVEYILKIVFESCGMNEYV